MGKGAGAATYSFTSNPTFHVFVSLPIAQTGCCPEIRRCSARRSGLGEDSLFAACILHAQH